MRKLKTSLMFQPDYIADSVSDLSLEELQRIGVSCLIFDVDNTLTQRGDDEVPEKYVRHIQMLSRAGLLVFIGSNSRRDLTQLAETLNATVLPLSYLHFKPRRRYYSRAIKLSRTKPNQIMMIGDRLHNDVIGAHRAGLKTTMVRPLHRRPGLLFWWYSRLAESPPTGNY